MVVRGSSERERANDFGPSVGETRDWIECQPVHCLLAFAVCAGLSLSRKIDRLHTDLDFIACVNTGAMGDREKMLPSFSIPLHIAETNKTTLGG
ncbi:hypothetical protein TNIN_301021 [Trichonephila inaurata madagascariensis]|uniref:Uncharacterized protein n=1 Tax=Trichonephila inaurata madagascariensis TaxID=2747483 RepID=A0A8X6MH43_9ARAC|nr:hypothetical protein TNIN_301021 [Trichonephila inaurata madagascariensis]